MKKIKDERGTTLLSITWAAYHGRPYMYMTHLLNLVASPD